MMRMISGDTPLGVTSRDLSFSRRGGAESVQVNVVDSVLFGIKTDRSQFAQFVPNTAFVSLLPSAKLRP